MMGIPAVWLLSHLVPRPGHFETRRGALAGAEVGPIERHPDGFVSQSVRVASSTGLAVDLRVLRRAAVGEPQALVLLLGGHRTGRDAIEVVKNPGNVVVAALDYPYHGPERPRGLIESLRSVPAIQQGLLDTPPAVLLALDWLITQPFVDPTRVELLGVSLGVPFAAVAGALDPRFRRVWLIHGSADNRAWLASRLEKRIPAPAVRWTAAGLLHLLAHGSTLRTAEWVPRIAPREVVVVGATEDEQMLRSQVKRLHAAAGEPKVLLWSEGGHVGSRRTDIVQQLLSMVRQRIEHSDARGE